MLCFQLEKNRVRRDYHQWPKLFRDRRELSADGELPSPLGIVENVVEVKQQVDFDGLLLTPLIRDFPWALVKPSLQNNCTKNFEQWIKRYFEIHQRGRNFEFLHGSEKKHQSSEWCKLTHQKGPGWGSQRRKSRFYSFFYQRGVIHNEFLNFGEIMNTRTITLKCSVSCEKESTMCDKNISSLWKLHYDNASWVEAAFSVRGYHFALHPPPI